jgi:hypothetical protein
MYHKLVKGEIFWMQMSIIRRRATFWFSSYLCASSVRVIAWLIQKKKMPRNCEAFQG